MDFKFQIGQLVYLRTSIADVMLALKAGSCAQPCHFVVVQRETDECPGGVQRHYTLSSIDKKFKANEIEIAKIADFNVEEWSDCVMANLLKEAERRLEKKGGKTDGK